MGLEEYVPHRGGFVHYEELFRRRSSKTKFWELTSVGDYKYLLIKDFNNKCKYYVEYDRDLFADDYDFYDIVNHYTNVEFSYMLKFDVNDLSDEQKRVLELFMDSDNGTVYIDEFGDRGEEIVDQFQEMFKKEDLTSYVDTIGLYENEIVCYADFITCFSWDITDYDRDYDNRLKQRINEHRKSRGLSVTD